MISVGLRVADCEPEPDLKPDFLLVIFICRTLHTNRSINSCFKSVVYSLKLNFMKHQDNKLVTIILAL